MSAIRFQTREKAAVQVYGKSGRVVASLRNLSQSGACLEWALEDVQVDKGDLIRLVVDLRNLKKRHEVSAEVIWRDGNRSGVAFLSNDLLIEKMMGKNL